ncbi:MAG TPA: AraC family transcriptional regulator [Clostridiaceae bacterium]|nr:AraC family transcriptional regulator [Clostridiaceae bacterium]
MGIKPLRLLEEILDERWNDVKVIFAEPWTVQWHVPAGERNDFEIHLLEKGEGRFFLGNREFDVKAGDIIFLHSLEGNSFKPKDGPFRFVFVTFKIKDSDSNGKVMELCEALKRETPVWSPENPDEIARLLYQMHKTISLRADGYMFRMKLLLGTLVSSIIENINPDGSREDVQFTINRGTRGLVDSVIMFLQKNYSMDIRLEDLGRLVNLHPRYLCTLFSKVTGQTITEYVRDLRIEKAKRLLLYTSRSITDIAFEVGFNNSQYFSRVFVKEEGMDPRTFRKIRGRR